MKMVPMTSENPTAYHHSTPACVHEKPPIAQGTVSMPSRYNAQGSMHGMRLGLQTVHPMTMPMV